MSGSFLGFATHALLPHDRKVARLLRHLDRLPVDLPEGTGRRGGRIVDPGAMTAILCVGPHAGFGRHMVAALHRLFPELFTNLVFVPAAARGGRWMTPFED